MTSKRCAHPLVLACAADDNYAMPMAVMLYSALTNYRGDRPIHIYVLDGGISGRHQQKIRKVLASFPISLHWLDSCAKALRDLPVRRHLTLVTYYRLLVPELLPGAVTKAIFLDCDLLVDGDLAKLWELDVSDRYLLAAQDIVLKFIASSPLAACPEVAFKGEDEYFNSGVLLMNLSRLREDCVAAKVIEFTQRWEELIQFPGQDGLNAVSIGKWSKLDPKWNRCAKRQFRRGDILHFPGRKKPWLSHVTKKFDQDYRGGLYRLYDDYLKASGWFAPIEHLSYVSTRAFHYYGSKMLARAVQIGRAARCLTDYLRVF